MIESNSILDHWDMWSSRNMSLAMMPFMLILDHWDMWSSRNLAKRSNLAGGF